MIRGYLHALSVPVWHVMGWPLPVEDSGQEEQKADAGKDILTKVHWTVLKRY
jgi:hypothetical protein